MRTRRRRTRSLSSLATRRVTSDRSFGSSTSFAKCRRSVETVGHPRWRIPLRRTQTLPNDQPPENGASRWTSRLVPRPLHRDLNSDFCETKPICPETCSTAPPVGDNLQCNVVVTPTTRPPRSVAVSAAHQGCNVLNHRAFHRLFGVKLKTSPECFGTAKVVPALDKTPAGSTGSKMVFRSPADLSGNRRRKAHLSRRRPPIAPKS